MSLPSSVPRSDAWLATIARALVVTAVVLEVGIVAVLIRQGALTFDNEEPNLLSIVLTVSLLSPAVIGGLLAARRPRHPVPWLLTLAVVPLAVMTIYLFLDPPSASWETTLLSLATALFFVAIIGFVLIFPLVFPEGRLVGPQWRWVLRAATLVIAAGLFWELFNESDIPPPPPYLGIGTAPGGDILWGVLDAAIVLAGIAVFGLGVASLVVRYRRGSPTLRRQMRVPFVGFALWVLVLALVVSIALFGTPGREVVVDLIFGLLPTVLALGIAVAVTRYGLYEVDRLVNRTVVYAIVVALLAVVFAAGAVWLPTLLPGESSSVAVAASTLAVAALFNPLRRWVQRFVDRRFYRSRYDAQQVADAFAARLRDQVDPEEVAAEWVEVVRRTLQPASVAVWLGEGRPRT